MSLSPAEKQVGPETAAVPNPYLGTVVLLCDSLTSTQVAVASCQNQVPASAYKIILPSVPTIQEVYSVTNKSDGVASSQKIVHINAIKQQVLHQASMKRNASHVQWNLLSMEQQQQMRKQLESEGKTVPTPVKFSARSLLVNRNKAKVLMPQLVEDCQRLLICQLVLKRLVYRVEEEEKKYQQKQKIPLICELVLKGLVNRVEKGERKYQKLKDNAIERKNRGITAKLQTLLVKHTNLLRKEIKVKKFLKEKEMQKMIMMERETQIKKMIMMDRENNTSSLPVIKSNRSNDKPLNKNVSMPPKSQIAKLQKCPEKIRLEQRVSNGLLSKKISCIQQMRRKKVLKKIESLKMQTDHFETGIKGPLKKKINKKIKIQAFESEFQSLASPPSTCKVFINGDKNCVCSCPFNNSSSLSSNDLAPCFNVDDFEKLLVVIKYLDDHAYEDEFDAAEKYYTFKLRSLTRSQQMFARNLINEVLVEAEKANLNSSVSLFKSLKEEQEQQEIDIRSNVRQNGSRNSFTEDRQVESNLKQPERGYLCPGKIRIFNKMQESLLKCEKQDHLIESCAPRLRSLSTVQYSFADKLINEILFEADFGRLTCLSELQLTYVKKVRRKNVPVITFYKKPLKSVISRNIYTKGVSKMPVTSSHELLLKSMQFEKIYLV